MKVLHDELGLLYRIDNITDNDKGRLYTLIADECLKGEIRYKRYYEEKLKEKCKLLENDNA